MVDKDKLTESFLVADVLASMEHLAKSALIKDDEEDLYRTNLFLAFEHMSHLYRNMGKQKNASKLH